MSDDLKWLREPSPDEAYAGTVTGPIRVTRVSINGLTACPECGREWPMYPPPGTEYRKGDAIVFHATVVHHDGCSKNGLAIPTPSLELEEL